MFGNLERTKPSRSILRGLAGSSKRGDKKADGLLDGVGGPYHPDQNIHPRPTAVARIGAQTNQLEVVHAPLSMAAALGELAAVRSLFSPVTRESHLR